MSKNPGFRCYRCAKLTFLTPTNAVRDGLRMWECPVCSAKVEFVDEPANDGSFAEVHRYKDGGGYSTLSMLNDPDCTVFQQAKPSLAPSKRSAPPPKKEAVVKNIWISHPESGCVFAGVESDLDDPTGCCVELGDCVSGTRSEAIALLEELGWNELQITLTTISENPPAKTYQPGDIVFAYDEDWNKTHRWHWGRKEWVALRKK